MNKIKFISNQKPLIIAGPCSAESKEQLFTTKKQKVIDSSNDLDSDIDSDVDEHGNIKGLIDYDYDEPDKDVDLDNLNIIVGEESEGEFETVSEEDETELEEELVELLPEDIDDEEMLIGKLLSKYIN